MTTVVRRRLPPEVLSQQEVTSLLDACGNTTWVDLRNRALISLMYRAGLRISEALWVQPKDVVPDAGVVRVLRAKGGGSRTVGIDPVGAAIVEEWITRRRGLGFARAAPLLCTGSDGRLSPGYARRLISQLGSKAGIEKRVHPHGLRHTLAAELRAEGVDIGVISRQLGHRSISTTARYLDHIAPLAVVDAMRRRTWSA